MWLGPQPKAISTSLCSCGSLHMIKLNKTTVVSVQSAMVSGFCVRPTSKSWFCENSVSDHETWSIWRSRALSLVGEVTLSGQNPSFLKLIIIVHTWKLHYILDLRRHLFDVPLQLEWCAWFVNGSKCPSHFLWLSPHDCTIIFVGRWWIGGVGHTKSYVWCSV